MKCCFLSLPLIVSTFVIPCLLYVPSPSSLSYIHNNHLILIPVPSHVFCLPYFTHIPLPPMLTIAPLLVLLYFLLTNAKVIPYSRFMFCE